MRNTVMPLLVRSTWRVIGLAADVTVRVVDRPGALPAHPPVAACPAIRPRQAVHPAPVEQELLRAAG